MHTRVKLVVFFSSLSRSFLITALITMFFPSMFSAASSIHFLLTNWNFEQVTLDFASDELWCLGICRPRRVDRTCMHREFKLASSEERYDPNNSIIHSWAVIIGYLKFWEILNACCTDNCSMSSASTSGLGLPDLMEMWCNICISELELELSYSRSMLFWPDGVTLNSCEICLSR